MWSPRKAWRSGRSRRPSARQLGVGSRRSRAEDVAGYFSFLAPFVALDNPTSNELTRELLGWEPTHPGLIEDLEDGHYFAGDSASS